MRYRDCDAKICSIGCTGGRECPEYMKWIPIEDREPKIGVPLIVMTRYGLHAAVYYFGKKDNGDYKFIDSYGDDLLRIVEYWLPLPEVPERKKEL